MTLLRLLGWAVLIGIGCLSYALVVVDDVVKRSGGDMPSVTRLLSPSTIVNIFDPPPDLRQQKDDVYVSVEEVEDTRGFKDTDCLEAKGSRFTHPKLAQLVHRECLLLGINTLD